MTFAAQLRPLVDRIGADEAARLCGVSRRTIYLWLAGGGNPARCAQVGTLAILRGARPRKDY